jgi:hypothetical protein
LCEFCRLYFNIARDKAHGHGLEHILYNNKKLQALSERILDLKKSLSAGLALELISTKNKH